MSTRVPPPGSLLDGHVRGKQIFPPTHLNATLDLAALVLVGVATFLGSEVVLALFGSLHVRCERKNERMTIYCCGRAFGQRASKWPTCLRAVSAEPTQAYAVEPRQIPRDYLSYSYKFVCITSCTYSSNYIFARIMHVYTQTS